MLGIRLVAAKQSYCRHTDHLAQMQQGATKARERVAQAQARRPEAVLTRAT